MAHGRGDKLADLHMKAEPNRLSVEESTKEDNSVYMSKENQGDDTIRRGRFSRQRSRSADRQPSRGHKSAIGERRMRSISTSDYDAKRLRKRNSRNQSDTVEQHRQQRRRPIKEWEDFRLQTPEVRWRAGCKIAPQLMFTEEYVDICHYYNKCYESKLTPTQFFSLSLKETSECKPTDKLVATLGNFAIRVDVYKAAFALKEVKDLVAHPTSRMLFSSDHFDEVFNGHHSFPDRNQESADVFLSRQMKDVADFFHPHIYAILSLIRAQKKATVVRMPWFTDRDRRKEQ